MILLREIQERDVDALEGFAQIPGFINLTKDKAAIREKIRRSRSSFKEQLDDKLDGKYIFVAEDLSSHKVIGTSLIAARHGTEGSPHFYFQVGSEERFSDTIQTGFIHGTLRLKADTDGPSEIGGLVLDPDQRNSDARVGRQISFVRFLFLALNRNLFKRKILAELMPPLNEEGRSPLWEAIGRRFTNMDYWEADQLCQKDKTFIFSLFPSGKIYTTFLSADARNAIGKVGRDTEPVLHMLKKIGFSYKNQIDPFDGGPHLWANVENIRPVKRVAQLLFADSVGSLSKQRVESGLLCKAKQISGEFRAVAVDVQRNSKRLAIVGGESTKVMQTLGLTKGAAVAFMPYY